MPRGCVSHKFYERLVTSWQTLDPTPETTGFFSTATHGNDPPLQAHGDLKLQVAALFQPLSNLLNLLPFKFSSYQGNGANC